MLKLIFIINKVFVYKGLNVIKMETCKIKSIVLIIILPILSGMLCLCSAFLLKILGIIALAIVGIYNYHNNIQMQNNLEKIAKSFGRKFDKKGNLEDGGNIIDGGTF